MIFPLFFSPFGCGFCSFIGLACVLPHFASSFADFGTSPPFFGDQPCSKMAGDDLNSPSVVDAHDAAARGSAPVVVSPSVIVADRVPLSSTAPTAVPSMGKKPASAAVAAFTSQGTNRSSPIRNTSECVWDLSGLDLYVGNASELDNCLVGECIDLDDYCANTRPVPVGVMTTSSVVGVNLGEFDRVGLDSISSEEDVEMSSDEVRPEASPNTSYSLEVSDSGDARPPLVAIQDSVYTVLHHAGMWDGEPIPAEVFEQGPKNSGAAFKPEQVLHHLKALRMPPDWQYAAPSEVSRSRSCPSDSLLLSLQELAK
ncbi:unnamed protein product [Linum trigynum]|uniref:Uncharacterized protein n=1 Tax=Linum trigynum TaxID=586398 RepID=A0AAV2F7H2_9ROSI